MGMFDSVMVECPKCGRENEFQSKAGDCGLSRYDISAVPHPIAYDIIGSVDICENKNCKTRIRIVGPQMPQYVECFAIVDPFRIDDES